MDRATSPGSPAGPLAGLRVLEWATGAAAGWCTRLLADLGADVVLAEPADGSPLRAEEPRRADGTSARFVHLSAGKRSVLVEDDSRLAELAAACDLLVSDADPEQVAGLVAGLPRVVVVGIRPFGATGPDADRPGPHLTVSAASGEMSTLPGGRSFELFPDRAPLQLGSDIGFADAGWNAAVAALAACYESLRWPDAQRVDVSVQESLLSLNRTRLNRYLNEGICVGRERNRYGIAGMLRCRDGWAQVVGIRDEHWDRLAGLPEGAEFAAAGHGTPAGRAADPEGLGRLLAGWCAARTRSEVVRVLAGVGVPAGAFAEPADLLTDGQLAHRDFLREVGDGFGGTLRIPGAPYRFSATPLPVRPAPELGSDTGFAARPPAPDPVAPGSRRRAGARLLDGVRVLDVTWAAAGPYATLLLAFLGAEVVKVESTRRPDPARGGFLARYEGLDRSPVFNELNLGKRSLQLDLTQPEAVALVRRLATEVDVVVDNFRPGVLDRLGLGPRTLLSADPGLVVASSSANGATGPQASGAGLASIFAATGGLSDQTGYPDGPPTEVGDPVDYRSGAALAVGILAGLLHRERTGEGQWIDLASREVVVASAPDALLAAAAGVPWRSRIGNGHRTWAPHGVHPCRDGGWLAVAVRDDDEWAALCGALDRPDWLDAFPGPAERRAAAHLLDEGVSAWTCGRSAAAAAHALRAAGVPAEPVRTFADLATDPHLLAREAFVDVEHPVLGAQRVLRPPWRFSAGGCGVPGPGPLLGADTAAVVAELGDDGSIEAGRRDEVFR
ncbi:CaiB/BaiF CoA-transferase family protein [Trujillonella endophytica]|uniref:Crotonobetainyl-CoA:carnitine CoA-transferase CaiB n=1 Tax=Trujillonella endophytica TaxID=673521 RepID=A0A1H8QLY7_9ACTN|nr:CoA transferase [Trujillella endophytica]SEO55021.1 Crotonobetainyl-CoA:carnitine CoA-transferase CaiB [Trujillella endophytica]